MNVYILFGQRKCDYPGQYAPEALEVMDEFAHDENGEWLDEKLAEAEKTGEFTAVRIIRVELGSLEAIRELVLGVPTIKGKVDSTGE